MSYSTETQYECFVPTREGGDWHTARYVASRVCLSSATEIFLVKEEEIEYPRMYIKDSENVRVASKNRFTVGEDDYRELLLTHIQSDNVPGKSGTYTFEGLDLHHYGSFFWDYEKLSKLTTAQLERLYEDLKTR